MPTLVDPDRCDGCRARAAPVCQEICPNDLMHLDLASGQAINVEADACWECFACVKACPQSAIAIRGYADVMPLGALVTPQRGEASIAWQVQFRDGRNLAFCFPIRTTPWGSIRPFEGVPPPAAADLGSPALCGEERFARARP